MTSANIGAIARRYLVAEVVLQRYAVVPQRVRIKTVPQGYRPATALSSSANQTHAGDLHSQDMVRLIPADEEKNTDAWS